MTSKYKTKQPKPIVKQTSEAQALALYVSKLNFAKCTNCGAKNYDSANTHSKCRCGGTCQTYKV